MCQHTDSFIYTVFQTQSKTQKATNHLVLINHFSKMASANLLLTLLLFVLIVAASEFRPIITLSLKSEAIVRYRAPNFSNLNSGCYNNVDIKCFFLHGVQDRRSWYVMLFTFAVSRFNLFLYPSLQGPQKVNFLTTPRLQFPRPRFNPHT